MPKSRRSKSFWSLFFIIAYFLLIDSIFPLEKIFHQSQRFHYIFWINNLGTLQRNIITVDTLVVKEGSLNFWHLLSLMVFGNLNIYKMVLPYLP